jgi:hypothetical protein
MNSLIENIMNMLDAIPTINRSESGIDLETQNLLLKLADKIYSLKNINGSGNKPHKDSDVCLKRTQKIQERLKPYTNCDIICTKCDIQRLDYMSTASFEYIINTVIIKISHGVADADSRDCYYFIQINDIDLAEEADLFDKNWLAECDQENVDQCQKILKDASAGIDFDLKWLIHLI